MIIDYTLPLYVQIGKRKIRRISLTMNWYRNAHFQVSNTVKKGFLPEGKPFTAEKISIDYHLTLSDNGRTDAMNWIAIADKFFLDWMTKRKMIPDDNANHYIAGQWSVDRDTNLSEHRLTAKITVLQSASNT